MTALLADPTFLTLRWEAVAAIGVWVTIGAYIALAVFARNQLREARDLRLDQARPFVIVDVAFRSFLIMLCIKNIGHTAAKDVKIVFDERLTSSIPDPGWRQDSIALTEGIPFMAPDREILFLLDSYVSRVENNKYPMVIRGTVTYSGGTARKLQSYTEPFVIDLRTYDGSQLPEEGMHELVAEVRAITKALTK